MALRIKQYKEKWRMDIENEELEFKNKEEFMKVFNQLLELKEKYGQIK